MRTKFFLRILIGLALLATAAGKLLDLAGFARILGTYEVFPDWALGPLATVIPLVELALGTWLLSGRRTASGALTALALHAAYAVWAAAALLRGLKVPNCGCFGVFFPRPLGWNTVVEDLGMVGLSAWLLVLARRRP